MSEKFIIDVDPGLDDSRALVYAFNNRNRQIIALTTCSGNVNAILSAYNAGLVATACDKIDIPIYIGSIETVDGSILEGDGYYGPNGMGNLQIFTQRHPLNKPTAAPMAIVTLINKFPNQIVLLMCGPLTNLAKAHKIDHSIAHKVKKVYILGGDRAKKTLHNFSPNCEFNANRDPLAYKIVFENFGRCNQPELIVFDWTVCVPHMVRSQFLDNIAEKIKVCPSKRHQAEILEARSEKLPNSTEEADSIYPGDEFVVASAFYPEIITSMHKISLKGIDLYDDPVNEKYKGKTYFVDDVNSNTYLVDEFDFNEWKLNFTNIILNQCPI